MRTLYANNSNMNSYSNHARVAVAMQKFGIQMIVNTSHGEMADIVQQYLSTPDSDWGNGRGKKAMFVSLKAKLLKEDRYFNKYPSRASNCNQRWIEFCDYCVILAALNHVLHEEPIPLVHPSQYADLIKHSLVAVTDGALPDFIDAPFMH